MGEAPFRCWIYKSDRLAETYLYLAREDHLEPVPAELVERLGPLRLVMQIDLHPGRRLARANVTDVLHHLRARGYHLQLPPQLRPALFAAESPRAGR